MRQSSFTSTRPSHSARRTNIPRKATPKPRAAGRKTLPPPTPSEAAFEAALAALAAVDEALVTLEEPLVAPGPRSAAVRSDDGFVERLYARSAEYLDDPYSTIADAARFHTKIAGVSFEGRQDVIAGLRAGAVLTLRREPQNRHDANAIAVHYGNLQLGFFNKRLAAHLAPLMDGGARYRASVASLTGGPALQSGAPVKHRGVNILVEREAAARVLPSRGAALKKKSPQAGREELAESIRAALIGSAQPHDAQLAVLERVEAGKNTLAVLGTGRGKSFCFQYAAALRAFSGAAKTLVVYPLRALANDQFEALRRNLDPLGLRCFRANGSIDNEERVELFDALRDGEWDIVLATPEFLEFHREALRGRSVPSLVVIDEAHHLAESRHRPAYARLAATVASLGRPQVLALTATAGDESFNRIVEDLRIEAWVVDPTIRENLHVVDARGTKEKVRYLTELFADSRADPQRRKAIVYCNSRSEVTRVARALRKDFGNEVAFYHGRMPSADRLEVERLFREGFLRIVIATSAFGEGIDLPDVADVVLYHLNFDFGEFNQQAGRAGRDGAPARIHLLYGDRDRSINEYLIDVEAPPLSRLREIYRGLKALARDGVVHGDDRAIAGNLQNDRLDERSVSAALRIFCDASLAEVGEDEEGRYVRLLPVRGKVDLESNERFAEGEATREAFARFCDLALNAPASTLERIINRPIYPSNVPLRR